QHDQPTTSRPALRHRHRAEPDWTPRYQSGPAWRFRILITTACHALRDDVRRARSRLFAFVPDGLQWRPQVIGPRTWLRRHTPHAATGVRKIESSGPAIASRPSCRLRLRTQGTI